MEGLLASILGFFGLTTEPPAPPPPGVVYVDVAALDEASGLAASAHHAGWYWAINDSGGTPTVWRFDANGTARGSLDIDSARNRDWESLDNLMWQGQPALLIADVGDNRGQRDVLELLLIAEPQHLPASATVLKRWSLQYSDGPRDCEAVVYDPRDHRVLLLSKRDDPPRLYAAALGSDRLVAEFLAEIDNIPQPTAEDLAADSKYGHYRSQPTGLALSGDGQTLVVGTYKHAYRYLRGPQENWAQAVARTPTTIALPWMPQTEGLSLSADASQLLAISEQSPARLAQVPLSPDNAPPDPRPDHDDLDPR